MEGIENFIEYCNEDLTDQWEKIIKTPENELTDFLEKEYNDLKSNIVDCLTSSTKSYHYVLPTQLLSKTVEPTRDCRLLPLLLSNRINP